MAKREFLMLAKVFDDAKNKIGGFYASEKLDGVRCFWDGGITRGKKTSSVPWAGVLHPKTGQLKDDITPIASGLWSRYGNPIVAPDWFLNTLPACPLDGELYAGRGRFQETVSFCKKKVPVDREWEQLQYAVFGSPAWHAIMAEGEISNSNQRTDIRPIVIDNWVANNCNLDGWISHSIKPPTPFSVELAHLVEWIDATSDTVYVVQQTKLPQDETEAQAVLMDRMAKVLAEGGEGLILRDPNQVWTPKRVGGLLKVKGVNDDEGYVTGFISGRETDKGSKLLGMIGALVLDYNGKRLELAGLTNEERQFATTDDMHYAADNPGLDMPDGTQGKHFRVGDRVTFLYRELTNDGIPKEARYFRQRQD